MRARIEAVVDAVLARGPAQRLMEGRHVGRLAVLAYHGVDDPQCFARQLDWLVERASPVSLHDVIDAVHGGQALPERAALVTFDDGHRSVVDDGLPLLVERGVPSVVYVVAGALDSSRPFWWTEVDQLARAGGNVPGSEAMSPAELVRALKRRPDDERLAAIDTLRRTAGTALAPEPQLRRDELRGLEAAGMAVGNHSLTHPCLTTCSNDKIRQEIVDAHRILTEALGHPPLSFAYPNGDVDERAVAVVRELGYRLAFLFDHRPVALPPDDPFRVSRVRVSSTTSLDRFRTIVSGLHPALHHMRGGS